MELGVRRRIGDDISDVDAPLRQCVRAPADYRVALDKLPTARVTGKDKFTNVREQVSIPNAS